MGIFLLTNSKKYKDLRMLSYQISIWTNNWITYFKLNCNGLGPKPWGENPLLFFQKIKPPIKPGINNLQASLRISRPHLLVQNKAKYSVYIYSVLSRQKHSNANAHMHTETTQSHSDAMTTQTTNPTRSETVLINQVRERPQTRSVPNRLIQDWNSAQIL